MRYFLLVCLLTGGAFISNAQTFTTVRSGNFSTSSTWSLNSIPPTETPGGPQTPCNCEIVVSAGHSLKISGNMSIRNANFVLIGTNSVLTFDNNVDLTILGTNSSIDVRSGARIIKGNNNNNILLGGQTIYDGQTTKVNSTVGGTVNGPASASASRVGGPQFLNHTLPVKLSEFKVIGNSGKVLLSWTTEQEVNSEYYQIERSDDGKSFHTIAIVSASGNSSVQLKYSYTDNDPLNGQNYYRLKIVDVDGKFEYSPVKNVNSAFSNSVLGVAPNPVSSMLNIAFSNPSKKDYQVNLVNRTGQIVYSQKFSGSLGKVNFQTANFPEGSYFIEVIDASGSRFTKNILILRNK
jgi:hypothetical protein